MSLGEGAFRRIRSPLAQAAALLAVFLLALPHPPPAKGQEPEVTLQLVRQPPSYSPGSRLNLTIRVVNTGDAPLEDYRLQLEIFQSVEGRLELHESFDGVDEVDIFSRVGPKVPALDPGESAIVNLDDKVDAIGPLLSDGVYPASFSLVDVSQVGEIGSLTTELVYYADKPRDPLGFVATVPMADISFKEPGGGFRADEEGRPLIAGVVNPETGWLAGVVRALEAASGSNEGSGFAAGLAPSPRLLEELSNAATEFASGDQENIGNEARQVLDGLSTLMTSGRLQPLLSPYAFVDLPTLTSEFDQETLNRQLSEANLVLENTLPDVSFDPAWFFAPGLRWDDDSLGNVRIAGPDIADKTFFTRHAISGNQEVGCPDVNQNAFAFACPVKIVTEGRPVNGFVIDPGLQERLVALTHGGDDPIELQRFFAETAMIHLEQPVEVDRVVSLSLPSQLHPPPYIARRLFGGLARVPWLRLLTPRGGLATGLPSENRDLATESSPLPSQPEDDYFTAIEDASVAVERYEEIGPPAPRLRRLHRNLLTAQSRLWWSEETVADGLEFATATQQEVEAEFDKISIKGLDTTLTSQSAPVELTVFNDATYDITIDIELSSEGGDIKLDREDLQELQDLPIAAGDNVQITVDARAESSGIFNLTAIAQTPQTGGDISSRTITIRSTNFNRIALGLTFGALAFLVLFYAWRWLRRRRRDAGASQQAQS
jgi:hypothetical protein